MHIDEKYKMAYEKLCNIGAERMSGQRFMAMGYTSNLDLLCDFDVARLNNLLAQYMVGKRLCDMQLANMINTMDDLLQSMVYYCTRGLGGEIDVENTNLVAESFNFTNGMGGTATQAAMALAEIGCPSIVHLTDDSKEVCDILSSPYIYTVSKDGELIHTDQIKQTHEQEIHFIIQFKKGDVICLGDQKISIPSSNRIILTKITVNEFVPFSNSFFKWIEDNAMKVRSHVVSSLNALASVEVLNERLDFLEKHVSVYKQRNPLGIVYFEDAHYHDNVLRKLCLERVYSFVDIVSLNEEELQHTLKMFEHEVDIEDIFSCVEGAKYLRKRFGIQKGVVIHTKDYSMYVGEKLQSDIECGLMYGNMMATAKAKNGWYGTLDQIKEVLSFELSQKGMDHYNSLKKMECGDDVVLVPSKYIDKPQYTIGLGDSFVGGVQMCF